MELDHDSFMWAFEQLGRDDAPSDEWISARLSEKGVVDAAGVVDKICAIANALTLGRDPREAGLAAGASPELIRTTIAAYSDDPPSVERRPADLPIAVLRQVAAAVTSRPQVWSETASPLVIDGVDADVIRALEFGFASIRSGLEEGGAISDVTQTLMFMGLHEQTVGQMLSTWKEVSR